MQIDANYSIIKELKKIHLNHSMKVSHHLEYHLNIDNLQYLTDIQILDESNKNYHN